MGSAAPALPRSVSRFAAWSQASAALACTAPAVLPWASASTSMAAGSPILANANKAAAASSGCDPNATGRRAATLAASPRSYVVESPRDVLGKTKLQVKRGSELVAEGDYRNNRVGSSSNPWGYIIGAVFAGALIALFEGFGYGQLQAVRLTFYPVALFLGLSAIILQMYVRKERVTAVRAKLFDFRDLREVLKVREIGVLLPVWLIISTILGIALTYLPRVLFEAKVGAFDIALLFGGVGLALLLLQPLWGKISDIVGRVPVMFYGILSILGVLVMAALFWDRILARDPLYLAPVGLFALGSGAFVPSALALMADTAPQTKYGATMGLYSFALGFGFFVAELSGLSIIAVSASSLPPNPSVEQVRAAIEGALRGLFYFALVLIAVAVLLMVRFFVIGRKKEREAAAAVEQLRNDPR